MKAHSVSVPPINETSTLLETVIINCGESENTRLSIPFPQISTDVFVDGKVNFSFSSATNRATRKTPMASEWNF
jgi:hypothetical protein